MIYLFAAVIFTNAFLLFWVEPLVAKVLLPYYGGAAGVWNTCVAFFQLILVGGYAYAHLGQRWPKAFYVLHSLLMVLAVTASFLWFRVAVPTLFPDPNVSLVLALFVMVGLSFFIIASHGPLLQQWFPVEEGNPYFLFAASNAGSLLGLLCFPLLLEAWWPAEVHILIWNVGLIMLCMAVGGLLVFLRPWEAKRIEPLMSTQPISWQNRLRWLVLAAIPSALMLAVTSYVSNEIAAVPLLWVVPLALYLLTFILVFGEFRFSGVFSRFVFERTGTEGKSHLLWGCVLLLAGGTLIYFARQSVYVTVGFHFALFFLVAWKLHGQLAASKPEPAKLTEFYLWLGLGGALGGMVIAFIAPLLFTRVHEYPLTLAAAIMFWGPGAWRGVSRKDWLIPAEVGLAVLVLALTVRALGWDPAFDLRVFLLVGALVILANQPTRLRVSLGIMVLLSVASFYPTRDGWWLVQTARSFYGSHKVYEDRQERIFWLQHGDTIHGAQMQGADLPLTYYSPMGPVGDMFRTFRKVKGAGRIGVVGLGIGSLLFYSLPQDEWTIFEVDEEVVRIARNERYFRYLDDARAPVKIVLGDGRISLAQEPRESFDMLIIDAFGSDSVPVHLLTKEALEIYLERLRPGGLLLFHTSSRFFDLSPVIATIADELGYETFGRLHTPAPDTPAIYKSRWLYLSKKGPYNPGQRWHPIEPGNSDLLWTDQHSSILSVL